MSRPWEHMPGHSLKVDTGVLERVPERPATPSPREGWEISVLPKNLPKSWSKVEDFSDGVAYRHDNGLLVMVSGARENDGKRWLHVSCSRKNRVPDYQEMLIVRNLFIGPEKHAIQVFPPQNQHISIHKFCLHLWHCLDGSPLPDFARGGDSI